MIGDNRDIWSYDQVKTVRVFLHTKPKPNFICYESILQKFLARESNLIYCTENPLYHEYVNALCFYHEIISVRSTVLKGN